MLAGPAPELLSAGAEGWVGGDVESAMLQVRTSPPHTEGDLEVWSSTGAVCVPWHVSVPWLSEYSEVLHPADDEAGTA